MAGTVEGEEECVAAVLEEVTALVAGFAEQVGEEYMNMLGRSDMPIVEVKISEPLENFCELGSMVCDIFKKLGATCKAGNKTGACPQKKAKKKATKKKAKRKMQKKSRKQRKKR